MKQRMSHKKITSGEVVAWGKNLIRSPELIRERIVYLREDVPLHIAAFLIDSGVKGVLMAHGGKNYHPLILLDEAGIPALSGVGVLSIAGSVVTIDASTKSFTLGTPPRKEVEEKVVIPKSRTPIYANVGLPHAIVTAASMEVDGIGLLRTEFVLARTLSRLLDVEISDGITVGQALEATNEADVVYQIAKHPTLSNELKADLKTAIGLALEMFRGKQVIVRTLDIARAFNDPMGNRGIRRCIAEGGATIRILAEAIIEALQQAEGNNDIGVVLPLVSHYSQISSALEILLSTGLRLRGARAGPLSIKYGWEIELPAAAINNELWLEAYEVEYGHMPHFIGFGTNDLTQFTIALGRDVSSQEKDALTRKYLNELYDETDISVVRQIVEVSKHCAKKSIRFFAFGEAAASKTFGQLMLSLGLIPSVSVDNVWKARVMAREFEDEGNQELARVRYISEVCQRYPLKTQKKVEAALSRILN